MASGPREAGICCAESKGRKTRVEEQKVEINTKIMNHSTKGPNKNPPQGNTTKRSTGQNDPLVIPVSGARRKKQGERTEPNAARQW